MTHGDNMLSLNIETELVIHATARDIWNVLTDFDAYPTWNPFIQSITGNFKHGGRLNVQIHPTHGKAMTFKPTIMELEPEHSLVWLGRFLMPHLLDGEHRFTLYPLADGSTRLVHSETFHGILLPIMRKQLSLITTDFEKMNTALQARVKALAE